jgi:uncharacterized coiled-coil DUF342 family protein
MMKKQTDFPLTLRGNRARTDAKIQELQKEITLIDVERARLNVKVSEMGLKVKESVESMKATEDWFLAKVEEQRDRLQSLNDRLRLVYILTGIAFGAALIFSIILLGAIMNVGSGGQITILFP